MTPWSRSRGAGRVLAALAVPLALGSGCGAVAGTTTGSTAGSTTGSTAGPAGGHPGVVRVGLTEWKILTSLSAVPAGTVRLSVTNAGATEHNLVVQGRAGTWHTDDLDPGQAERISVVGRPGETLRLWCSEPGHEIQGMHTTLQVRS